MTSAGAGASPYVAEIEEGSLSGPMLAELLTAVLGKGVPFRFQAKGSSMFPFIRNGDTVTVSPWTGGTPRPGAVVAFRHPQSGRIVVHRVIQRLEGSFVARGDNRSEADGRIPVAEIVGRVTRVERRGRRVLFGLGAERVAIVLLTRTGLIPSLLAPAWRAIRDRIRMENSIPATVATERGPDASSREGEAAQRVPVDPEEAK